MKLIIQPHKVKIQIVLNSLLLEFMAQNGNKILIWT